MVKDVYILTGSDQIKMLDTINQITDEVRRVG